jgi:MFS family permease
MIAGPFVIVPLANKFGRSSILFWCMFVVAMSQIWAARMVKHNDYVAFVLSRLFSGFGGTVPSVIGNQIITDLFFIHERGRAFSIFHLSFLFGPVGIPTISGFISAHVSWTVMYWWTLGLLGLTLICIFFFMEETGFSRGETSRYPSRPESFVANRVATFLPGNKVVPKSTLSDFVS